MLVDKPPFLCGIHMYLAAQLYCKHDNYNGDWLNSGSISQCDRSLEISGI